MNQVWIQVKCRVKVRVKAIVMYQASLHLQIQRAYPVPHQVMPRVEHRACVRVTRRVTHLVATLARAIRQVHPRLRVACQAATRAIATRRVHPKRRVANQVVTQAVVIQKVHLWPRVAHRVACRVRHRVLLPVIPPVLPLQAHHIFRALCQVGRPAFRLVLYQKVGRPVRHRVTRRAVSHRQHQVVNPHRSLATSLAMSPARSRL